MLAYPTIREVEQADRIKLAYWYRFLPSPGMNSISVAEPEFTMIITRQRALMDRITARFKEAGGFNPAVSKAIGWDQPAAASVTPQSSQEST